MKESYLTKVGNKFFYICNSFKDRLHRLHRLQNHANPDK